MTIRLHDTMAREKREFVPADPKRITMYVCGPTVYGRAHIGNARPAVVFDTLARLIRHTYGQDSLVYARNVTDVDDKIIAAAEAEGVGYRRITERYYKDYMDDMGALNVLQPNFEPRATAFVPRMIDMIQRLIAEGHAYEAEGHVLFSVPSDPEYGALSRRDRDAILAGARVEVAPYKRDAADFVLWKPAGASAEQVALSFDSPWGRGRPGWHIECSAMIEAFADSRGEGETIDIHGGGLDLIFPHHENEIAQSRCAHGGAPLARYWVHNGFVDMAAEKMSKSLGNVVTVGDLLAAGHRGEVLRLALLSAHYRKPLPWTAELIERSRQMLDGWARRFSEPFERTEWDKAVWQDEEPDSGALEALRDDLNIAEFFSVVHRLADRVAGESAQENRRTEARVLGATMELIGIDLAKYWRDKFESVVDEIMIHQRISERAEAKTNRDFATADRIRDELKAEGILLEDSASGTTWRRE
jgi:cysteinyl-tRNA synthetase